MAKLKRKHSLKATPKRKRNKRIAVGKIAVGQERTLAGFERFGWSVETTDPKVIRVKAAFDPETSRWYVAESSVAGLFLEGDTLDELHEEIVGGIEDLTGQANAEVNLILPSKPRAAA